MSAAVTATMTTEEETAGDEEWTEEGRAEELGVSERKR